MVNFTTLSKRILLTVSLFLMVAYGAMAQYCNTATTNDNITITTSVQNTTSYSNGRRAFTFNTVAGNTYTFSTCGLATGDTRLRLYSTGTGGTVLANNDDFCSLQSQITYTETVSSTRSLLLTLNTCAVLTSATQVSYVMTLPPPAPANDACANATSLPCATTNLAGTTVSAVSETAPLSLSSPYGVWYKFTGDGLSTTITTSGGTLDVEMLIMSGTTCGAAYTQVADVDNGGAGATETYTFTSTNSTQYYIYIAHWSTSSTTTGTFNISRTCVTPPNCATLTAPAASATNVCTNKNFTWTAPATGGAPTGYKLYLGTDVAATNLVNGTNLGNVLTYTPSLTVGNTYYWKIVPTNGQGDATGCSIQSFSTVAAMPTVSVNPATTSICMPGASPVALTASGASTYAWSSGSGNPNNVTPLTTTTYTVTGTDANTCTASATATVTVNPAVTMNSVTASPSSNVCFNGNTNLFANATKVVTSAAQYIWSSSSAVALETIITPVTTTTVTTPDNDDGSNTITPSPAFSFPLVGSAYSTFYAGTNGYVSLTSSTAIPSSITSLAGINAIFAFGRDANMNTTNAGNLTHGAAAGGKYVFQFTKLSGASGGAESATIYATIQVVLWGSASSNPGRIDIIYGANAGTPGTAGTIGIRDALGNFVNAVASGSTSLTTTATAWPLAGTMYSFTPPAPSTYTWSPGTFLSATNIKNPSATNVTATQVYNVTASDGGCSATGTITISTSPLTVSATTFSSPVCNGKNFTATANSLGGGAPINYAWSVDGGTTINTGTTNTLTQSLATGSHSVVVTVSDACGVTVSDTRSVSVKDNPTVATSGGTVCGATPFVLTATGSTATYAWSPSAGLSAATGSPVNATPASPTTYTVTATNTDGCTATASAAVDLIASINAPTTTNQGVCLNGTVTGLTATCSGATAPVSVASLTGQYPGTIGTTGATFVRPFSGAGCSISTNTVVYQTATFVAPATGSYTFEQCPSSGFDAFGFLYDGSFNPASPCTNFLVGNDDDGPFAGALLTQSLTAGQTVIIVSAAFDAFESGTYDWTITGPGFTTTGPYAGTVTTKWYATNSSTTVLATGSTFNPTLAPTFVSTATPGTYTYYAACSAGSCESARTPAVFTVAPVLSVTASASVPSVCVAPTATALISATVNAGASPYNYFWSTGASGSGVLSIPSVSVTPALGANVYTVTVTDACGGNTVSSVTVTGNAIPSVSVSASNGGVICGTGSVTLTASGAAGYTWSPSGSGSAPIVSPTSTTTYTVTGTTLGCSATASAVVTVNSAAPVTTGATVCVGASGTISTSTTCQTLTTTLSGAWNTTSSPTAIRPGTSTNSPICSFPTANVRSYEAVNFQVSVTGSYTFEMNNNTNYDGMAYIVTGAFVPGSCATGTFVIGDDDSSPVDDEPQMIVTLTTGVTYTLVSTTWTASTNDPFSWTITPPAGGQLILNPGTMEWWSQAIGGSVFGSGSPFNPVPSALANTLAPGTTTLWAACSNNSQCRTATTFTVTNCPANVWEGDAAGDQTNWFNAANWANNAVPVCGTAATIPTAPIGGANFPVVSGGTLAEVGTLTVQSGAKITLNAQNLKVCGNLIGSSTTTYAQIDGSGVAIMAGSALQSISGRTKFETLQLDNAAGAQISGGNTQINTALELKQGNFKVSNIGFLTFLSTSSTHCAVLDNFSSGFTGAFMNGATPSLCKAQRYYGNTASAAYNQHYMGSPMKDMPLGQFAAFTNNFGFVLNSTCTDGLLDVGSPYGNLYKYDETNGAGCAIQSWYAMGPASLTGPAALSENGKGYLVKKNGPGTLTVNGTPNVGATYSRTGLTNSGWAQNFSQPSGMMNDPGWNFLANPYLAALDLGKNNSTRNGAMDAQIQIWDQAQGNYQAYVIGTSPVIPVAPFQGFFVHNGTPNNTAGSFTINGNDRSRAITGTFYQQANDHQLSIDVTNPATGLTDRTLVSFNTAATNQFDGQYDANKLAGNSDRHTLYTVNGNQMMAFNTLKSIEETSTVDMSMYVGATGSYTMSFDGISSFDPTSYIMLEDKQLNVWHNARNGNYTFSANATDNKERFVLHFTPKAEITANAADCNTNGTISIVQPGTASWNYTIANTNGTVATGTLNQNNPIAQSATPGVYTVTLVDNNNYTVVKQVQVIGTTPVTANMTASANTAEVAEDINFSNTTNNVTTTSWNFGDGSTATTANASHNYQSEGVYTVTLTTGNADGCQSSTSQTVTVTAKTISGIGNLTDKSNISIWSNENKVYVDLSQEKHVEATIEIYNIIGQQLSQEKFGSKSLYTKQLNNLEAAYVIVRVMNDDKITTKKVFISGK